MWNRFWIKVDASGGIGTCWPWLASCNTDGYGQFWVAPTQVRAHRFAYEMLIGSIPDGLTLDHLCRRRECVNPWHAEPVTHHVNIMRGKGLAAANAQKKVCPRCGSDFTTYWHTTSESWKRFCATCKADQQRQKFSDPHYRERYKAGQRISRAKLRARRRSESMGTIG